MTAYLLVSLSARRIDIGAVVALVVVLSFIVAAVVGDPESSSFAPES